MSPWTLVDFKNAGPDSSLRVAYKGRDGKAHVGNMGIPWRRAAIVRGRGQITYRDISRELQEQGFVRIGPCNARLKNFSGPCIEYRVQLYGVFRYSWFLRRSGIGYAKGVYWNFAALKRVVKRLERLRADERRYLSSLGRMGRGVPTEEQFDKARTERDQYRSPYSFLVQNDDLTGMSFVSLPGFEYVANEAHRALLVRLYKILCEWPFKQSDSRGPKRGSRLTNTEIRLIAKKRDTASARKIASEIEAKRQANVGREPTRPTDALIKQVRRAMKG